MPRDEGEGRVEDLFLRCTRTDVGSRRDGDLWRADYARLLLVKSLLVSADRAASLFRQKLMKVRMRVS